ncbi:c-type cytochrome [Rhizomicrobium electricum]|uniref:Cytochrome c domain-containing protein n=1 Tax=Rhizomicrobium electricum TaxID=480070 RepID=A0ABP3Q7H3_9PROT|nr:c-type cytochrome [Rhizomicrobium electricum]NIJ49399.1 cytochrome c [Rhizomicrobium electricum]
MLRYGFAALAALIGITHNAAAAGNAKHGEQVFGRCAQCHNAKKGGGNGLGPNLSGVAGRKAASLPNFYYSPALKNSGIVWTDAKLKLWLANPQKLVPGTRMAFAGLKQPQDVDDVIAYLHSKK